MCYVLYLILASFKPCGGHILEIYRTFNSGHFYNPRTVMVTVMNFYSYLFKHWYQIDQNKLTCTLPRLKFNKLIMRGISPGNISTDNGQELTIHEENEVMHILTNFNSRSHTFNNSEPQMTVLAKVEKKSGESL